MTRASGAARSIRVVGILLVGACGNGDKPTTNVTKAVAPVIDAPVAEAPTVPLPHVDWPETTGPAGPILLKRTLRTPGRWRFSGTVEALDRSMRARASLELSTQGDGKARLITEITPEGDAAGHRSELDFDEAGISAGDPTGALVAMLWPVPPRAMRPGESATAPFHFPLTVQGRSKSDWTQTVTFVGYSQIGAIVCARFSSEAVMELADDGEGNAGHASIGIQYCLEPATGMLVASVSSMTTETSVWGTRSRARVLNRFSRDPTN